MKEIYIDDLREEFVKDYVFPMFRWLQTVRQLLILLALAAIAHSTCGHLIELPWLPASASPIAMDLVYSILPNPAVSGRTNCDFWEAT